MKVRLVKPLATDAVVTVTLSDAAIVPQNVTVVAGQTEAALSFNAVSQIQAATITAKVVSGTITTSATGTARVLGLDEAPTAVALSPLTTTVAPGATKVFIATLDIPAPAPGATVTLNIIPNDGAIISADRQVRRRRDGPDPRLRRGRRGAGGRARGDPRQLRLRG